MPSPLITLEEEDTMRELLIVFQDGFDEANITVMVNGKEVRRDEGVTTNPLLGEAFETSIELPAKGAQVGVEVTNRGLKAITKVSGKPKSLLVSIQDDQLVMREGTGREAFL
ncbi:hypothetical protein ABIB27_002669 [Arthrobacter sp. UYEF21]